MITTGKRTQRDTYAPISDYGVIGNLHTVALVNRHGGIDYLPLQRIDSPTVFAAILDRHIGGFYEITCAQHDANTHQMYLPETNILLTRFMEESGVAELTDYMPICDDQEHMTLVRAVRQERGELEMAINMVPRYDYARTQATVTRVDHGYYISGSNEQPDLYLLTDAELYIDPDNNSLHGHLRLQGGDERYFVLTTDPDLRWGSDEVEEHFNCTLDYWKEWSAQCTYTGKWRNHVLRSVLALKLLQSRKYGSVVAAGTFGLPEGIGGERNWDYRYLWIRDAAFTMYAFLRLGFMDEAHQFMEWMKDRCLETGLQLIYRVDGGEDLEEIELNHLEGYEKSSPVRIGNGASGQTQLDIYGELVDTIYLYVKYAGSITYDFWERLQEQIEYVIKHHDDPDHGIWEVRGGKQHFLSSKVICWVALDRALRIADICSFPHPRERWYKTRDRIHHEIYRDYYNEAEQAFTQYKGSSRVDAAALLMPLLRFCSSSEPKWVSTFERIEHDLVTAPLVYRYCEEEGGHNIDGLDGNEGTFSICSFWYVECLARRGKLREAELNFEKMMGYANHLGLYAEQIGLDGRQLGNFPQAFTHLALISAAYQIEKKEGNMA